MDATNKSHKFSSWNKDLKYSEGKQNIANNNNVEHL